MSWSTEGLGWVAALVVGTGEAAAIEKEFAGAVVAIVIVVVVVEVVGVAVVIVVVVVVVVGAS